MVTASISCGIKLEVNLIEPADEERSEATAIALLLKPILEAGRQAALKNTLDIAAHRVVQPIRAKPHVARHNRC